MQGDDRFASYRLESVIGRGGAGVVYAAFDTVLERRVALKVLAPEHSQNARFRERFSREIRTVTALTHPHVVPVHTHGVVDGRLYLDMALVEGPTLASVIASGPIPLARTVDVVGQLADALGAAHSRGLVHRDVKPSNVLMARGRRDHAYLCDFGLARPFDAGARPDGPAGPVGTVAYMSPEQIDVGAVDARTDVYALGALLFHCLSGRLPFTGASSLDVLDAHRSAPVPRLADALTGPVSAHPLGDHPAAVWAALDQVIATAMEKDPARRFPGVDEFAAALLGAADGVAPPRGAPAAEGAEGPDHDDDEGLATWWSTAGGAYDTTLGIGAAGLLAPGGDPLIGRDDDVAALAALVDDEPLLTLVGSGGVGKTRLAVEVASRWTAGPTSSSGSGAWFVDLSQESSADRVPWRVASALGLDVASESPLAAISSWSSGRRALVVLDNLEQLAPHVTAVVEEVRRTCPDLRLLLTSRAATGATGERVVPVEPLPVPGAQLHSGGADATPAELEELVRVPSVRLFVDRARQAQEGFELTAENAEAVAALCARVDGIPLALEIVAGHSRDLTPQAMLWRLSWTADTSRRGSGPAAPRHQSLAATVDWSYRLLPPAEQRLLRSLSVLSGTFETAAAVALARTTAPEPSSLKEDDDGAALLAALVQKNLVRSHPPTAPETDPRYSLLVTVREFARDRLAEAGEARAARAAAAAHFTAAVTPPSQRTPEDAARIRRVAQQNLHHLLDALEVTRLGGDRDAELALLQPVVLELIGRTRAREALTLITESLSRSGGPLAARTWCLTAGEVAAYNSGLWDEAPAWLERAEREIAEATGEVDPSAVVDLRIAQLGYAMTRGEAKRALDDIRRLLQQEATRFQHTPRWSLEHLLVGVSGTVVAADPAWVAQFLREQLEKPHDLAHTPYFLNSLAEVLARSGHPREALEVLDRLQECGPLLDRMRLYADITTVQATTDLGEYQAALDVIDAADEVALRSENQQRHDDLRLRRARVLRRQGDVRAARAVLESVVLPPEGEEYFPTILVVHHVENARLHRAAGDLEAAAAFHARAWEVAAGLGILSHDEYLEAWMEGVAQVCERQPRTGAVLLGAVLEYSEDFMPQEEPVAPLLGGLARRLGEVTAGELVAAGRGLEPARDPDWTVVVDEAARVAASHLTTPSAG